MHHVSWKQLLDPRQFFDVLNDFLILIECSILAKIIMHIVDLINGFLRKAQYFARVHQFLLRPDLFHNKLIRLQILIVLFTDIKQFIIHLFFLPCLLLDLYLSNFIYHVFILIILYDRRDDLAVDLVAIASIRAVGEDPHHSDVEKSPIVHIPRLRCSHVELFIISVETD